MALEESRQRPVIRKCGEKIYLFVDSPYSKEPEDARVLELGPNPCFGFNPLSKVNSKRESKGMKEGAHSH